MTRLPIALAIVLLCQPLPAAGQESSSAPFAAGNVFVCTALETEMREQARQLNSRRLNEFLFDAAGKGCPDVVMTLLERGASVAARDRFGNTAFHHAADAGHVAIMELLVAQGADIDLPNLAGSTPLLRAVTGNRRKAVQYLLEAGARTGPVNRNGIAPLAAAAYHGNDRVVALLIDHGADPAAADGTGKGPIVYAAARGYLGIVGMLLDRGVDVDHRYAHDLTALMWAAGHTNDTPEGDGLRMVEYLIERGADIEAEDDRGWTPVMIASARGHAAIVRLLRRHGTDIAHRAKDGRRAIELAAGEPVREALTE